MWLCVLSDEWSGCDKTLVKFVSYHTKPLMFLFFFVEIVRYSLPIMWLCVRLFILVQEAAEGDGVEGFVEADVGGGENLVGDLILDKPEIFG